MKIETYTSGIYRVLKISDQIIITDLQELKLLIQGYLEQDEKYIAVHFVDVSYLYSGAIAILVSCFKMIRDKSGNLCLLEPKSEVVDLLQMIGIDSLIPIFGSIEELPVDPHQINSIPTKECQD